MNWRLRFSCPTSRWLWRFYRHVRSPFLRANNPHSNSGHSADNLCFPGIGKVPKAAARQRMGHKGQLIPLQFTPRASIPTWNLHEIDWPIQFCPPRRGAQDFAHLVVYLYERARWDEGIHHVVSKADIAVLGIPDIQVPNDGNRYLAPNSNQA